MTAVREEGAGSPPAADAARREWPAFYLDGKTAARHPATVRLMGEGLEVTTGTGTADVWRYRDIKQTQGFYEGEEVRLERGGPEVETLIVPDPTFLRSLRQAGGQGASRFHDPATRGQRRRLTVLAGLAVVAITAAIYFWGIPALALIAAPQVPVAWEEALGRSMMAHLAPPSLVCTDPQGQQALDALMARLVAAGGPSPYRYQTRVINRSDVNALAGPGGQIVVFRGLLDRARSPEQLAGVLAHEIAHVERRHSTRALIQHASTGLLLAALTGDMTGPLAYALESARVLGQLQYSRHAEEEADREGMRRLLAARVAPEGVISFFEAIVGGDQPRNVLRYLSTHPSPGDRVRTLRELAAAASGSPPAPILSEEEWSALKHICAPPSPGTDGAPAR